MKVSTNPGQGAKISSLSRSAVELPGPLHRDLAAYAEVLARETGQPAADPVRLIVPMLERFIATDRGFASARRSLS